MYEKVATVTVSIEEMVSLGQGRGVQTDRDSSYFPKTFIIFLIPVQFKKLGDSQDCQFAGLFFSTPPIN